MKKSKARNISDHLAKSLNENGAWRLKNALAVAKAMGIDVRLFRMSKAQFPDDTTDRERK